MDIAKVSVEVANDKVERIRGYWPHGFITRLRFYTPVLERVSRTARLSANLILERYGLVGISIRMEKRIRIVMAFSNADTMGDIEPLKAVIYDGIIDVTEESV